MLVEIKGAYVQQSKTANGRIMYKLSEHPYLPGKRINKKEAEKIQAEQDELCRLIKEYAAHHNVFESKDTYTIVFYMKHGTARINFTTLEQAVECSRYVVSKAKVFEDDVYVWYNHKWMVHFSVKEHIEEYADRD